MQVVSALKENKITLADLTNDLGIVVKSYPESGLMTLSYSQIESPKAHPYVLECRGLILDKDFNVVARGFDRFFNFGEQGIVEPDSWDGFTVHQKADGSNIKLYNHNGVWYAATSGTCFAESLVDSFANLTFKSLVLKAMDCESEEEFQSKLSNLPTHLTYIFELTSLENRVVTRYTGYDLWLLAVRDIKSGEYIENIHKISFNFRVKYPSKFLLGSASECIEAAKELKDLEEGFVVYKDNIPFCKIKSPLYVAVHHLKGEVFSLKLAMTVVILQEHDEYLKYFPEKQEIFDKIIVVYDEMVASARELFSNNSHLTGKDFALQVKHHPLAGAIFEAKKRDISIHHAVSTMRQTAKLNILNQEYNKKYNMN